MVGRRGRDRRVPGERGRRRAVRPGRARSGRRAGAVRGLIAPGLRLAQPGRPGREHDLDGGRLRRGGPAGRRGAHPVAPDRRRRMPHPRRGRRRRSGDAGGEGEAAAGEAVSLAATPRSGGRAGSGRRKSRRALGEGRRPDDLNRTKLRTRRLRRRRRRASEGRRGEAMAAPAPIPGRGGSSSGRPRLCGSPGGHGVDGSHRTVRSNQRARIRRKNSGSIGAAWTESTASMPQRGQSAVVPLHPSLDLGRVEHRQAVEAAAQARPATALRGCWRERAWASRRSASSWAGPPLTSVLPVGRARQRAAEATPAGTASVRAVADQRPSRPGVVLRRGAVAGGDRRLAPRDHVLQFHDHRPPHRLQHPRVPAGRRPRRPARPPTTGRLAARRSASETGRASSWPSRPPPMPPPPTYRPRPRGGRPCGPAVAARSPPSGPRRQSPRRILRTGHASLPRLRRSAIGEGAAGARTVGPAGRRTAHPRYPPGVIRIGLDGAPGGAVGVGKTRTSNLHRYSASPSGATGGASGSYILTSPW